MRRAIFHIMIFIAMFATLSPHSFAKEKSYLRDLEKSLYYQGFGEEILNSFTESGDGDSFCGNLCEVPQGSNGNIKILDAQKSFYYAQLSFNKLGNADNAWCVVANLAKHYICGIGTDVDYQKAWKLINREKTMLAYLAAYMYFKGYGVEKDDEKLSQLLSCAEYVYGEYSTLNWENFYTGKFVPQDFDFTIFLLEHLENEIAHNYILYLIYSGKLNVNLEKNPEIASRYFQKFEELKNAKKAEILKGWAEKISENKSLFESTKKKTYQLREALIYLEKNEPVARVLNEVLVVENPNFNPDLAREIMAQNYNGGLCVAYYVMINRSATRGDFDETKKYLDIALRDANLTSEDKAMLRKVAESLLTRNGLFRENPRNKYFKKAI